MHIYSVYKQMVFDKFMQLFIIPKIFLHTSYSDHLQKRDSSDFCHNRLDYSKISHNLKCNITFYAQLFYFLSMISANSMYSFTYIYAYICVCIYIYIYISFNFKCWVEFIDFPVNGHIGYFQFLAIFNIVSMSIYV